MSPPTVYILSPLDLVDPPQTPIKVARTLQHTQDELAAITVAHESTLAALKQATLEKDVALYTLKTTRADAAKAEEKCLAALTAQMRMKREKLEAVKQLDELKSQLAGVKYLVVADGKVVGSNQGPEVGLASTVSSLKEVCEKLVATKEAMKKAQVEVDEYRAELADIQLELTGAKASRDALAQTVSWADHSRDSAWQAAHEAHFISQDAQMKLSGVVEVNEHLRKENASLMKTIAEMQANQNDLQKEFVSARAAKTVLEQELEDEKKKTKCEGSSDCRNCPYHLRKAMRIALAAEAAALDMVDKASFDRMNAWSALHDMQTGCTRPDSASDNSNTLVSSPVEQNEEFEDEQEEEDDDDDDFASETSSIEIILESDASRLRAAQRHQTAIAMSTEDAMIDSFARIASAPPAPVPAVANAPEGTATTEIPEIDDSEASEDEHEEIIYEEKDCNDYDYEQTVYVEDDWKADEYDSDENGMQVSEAVHEQIENQDAVSEENTNQTDEPNAEESNHDERDDANSIHEEMDEHEVIEHQQKEDETRQVVQEEIHEEIPYQGDEFNAEESNVDESDHAASIHKDMDDHESIDDQQKEDETEEIVHEENVHEEITDQTDELNAEESNVDDREVNDHELIVPASIHDEMDSHESIEHQQNEDETPESVHEDNIHEETTDEPNANERTIDEREVNDQENTDLAFIHNEMENHESIEDQQKEDEAQEVIHHENIQDEITNEANEFNADEPDADERNLDECKANDDEMTELASIHKELDDHESFENQQNESHDDGDQNIENLDAVSEIDDRNTQDCGVNHNEEIDAQQTESQVTSSQINMPPLPPTDISSAPPSEASEAEPCPAHIVVSLPPAVEAAQVEVVAPVADDVQTDDGVGLEEPVREVKGGKGGRRVVGGYAARALRLDGLLRG